MTNGVDSQSEVVYHGMSRLGFFLPYCSVAPYLWPEAAALCALTWFTTPKVQYCAILLSSHASFHTTAEKDDVLLSDKRALLIQVQPCLKVHSEQTWERCDGYPDKSITCYVSVLFLVLMEAPSTLEHMRLQVVYHGFLTTHIINRQKTQHSTQWQTQNQSIHQNNFTVGRILMYMYTVQMVGNSLVLVLVVRPSCVRGCMNLATSARRYMEACSKSYIAKDQKQRDEIYVLYYSSQLCCVDVDRVCRWRI